MTNGNLISASISDNLPAMVRDELANLPAQRQEEFVEEYRRKAKSAGPAYLLLFLIGGHYIYLRKWGIQFLFWVTLGGLLIWWLVDFFRIPGMIRDYNKDVAVGVLRNLKVVTG